MEKQSSPKVLIDSARNEQVPSVFVAPPQQTTEKPTGSLLTRIVHRFVNFVLDFLETIVVALSIFVVIYLFIMQPHEIKGQSMEPNFHDSEYILTDKVSYRLHDPNRGDVIVFKAPTNNDVDYIKRVIGLPGDKIKIQNGAVYVNDVKLTEDYLKDTTSLFPGSFLSDGQEITVPSGDIFVMGDNRPHSSDSRVFGPVPIDTVIGRAFFRYWPVNLLGTVPQVRYNI